MREYISFDSHKRYTLAEREDRRSGRVQQTRIEHQPGALRTFLRGCEPGTPVAVEAIGNWYWIIDEIEQARMIPRLVHPRKAKLMMGMVNKTDKLDVHGLNTLQRNGTLPTVWIPPAELRDLREVTRVRVSLGRARTKLKNRIHATLDKYALGVEDYSDSFGPSARRELVQQFKKLPEQTAWACRLQLDHLDFVQGQIRQQEDRLRTLLPQARPMQLLDSLPGVGLILAAAIGLEIGDVSRFASSERLASYAGTTPRVHASGGKVRYGTLRRDVNHYLKWAFSEAANSVAVNHARRPERHVSQLYKRIKRRKGHHKAIGAVARHLAEAAYHVLRTDQTYQDPALRAIRQSRRNNQDASATLS